MGLRYFSSISAFLRPLLFFSFALPLLGPVACAQADEEGQFHYLVYGTLGISHDDSSNLAAMRDISQRPKKLNLMNNSWVKDSRIGLQASYQFNSYMDVMTQGVLRDQYDTSLNRYLDWAYVNVHPTPALDARLGRVGYDVFLMSDHRNLGYAYPWVRPPVEFYGWVPVYSIDGGDVAYTLQNDAVRWRFKGQMGRTGLKFPMGADAEYNFKSDQIWSISIARETDTWRIKGGYSQCIPKTDASMLAPLQSGLAAVSAAGIPGVSNESSDLLRELTYKDVTLRYVNLGLAYDDGTWLGQAELGSVVTTADMMPNGTMAYIGLGRRLGDFTPFMLLSGIRSNAPVRQTSGSWAVMGPSGPILQTAVVKALNSTRFDQETGSLGVRWDANSHVALKVQWDSTHIYSNGYGLWYSDEGQVTKNARVNMLSATMDFIF
ncbi:MAG: hypothetical protein HQL79_10415 [Magnetococcales bacterium]|nr:hypothetical protein [Magnetococcales bacterium]